MAGNVANDLPKKTCQKSRTNEAVLTARAQSPFQGERGVNFSYDDIKKNLMHIKVVEN